MDGLLHPCRGNETANSSSCQAQDTASSSSTATFDTDYTKIAVLSTITILTVLGNVCVILAIFCRQMKMTRMYYFILHLSLADLLTAFFTLLPEIIWTSTLPHFYGGDFVCKSIKFLQMTGPYLSSYVLIMTAFDRFQAICHPLSNCTWTPRRSNAMISVAWIISFLLCVPQIFIFRDKDDFCSAQFPPVWGIKAYVTWFAFSNFFIPFIFLIFCYGRICHAIWDNFNSKTTIERTNEEDTVGAFLERLRRRWQLSRLQEAKLKVRMNRKSSDEEEGSNDNAMIVIEPPSSPTAAEYQQQKQTTSFCQFRRSSSGDSSRSNSPPPPITLTERVQQQQPPGAAAATHNPRAHSVRGISRAKIKTVKLTVVVILGYIVCSAPFTCVQLYSVWGDPSEAVMNSLEWLFWLLTLNSVVNPWIYMFFNTNLVESLYRACCPVGFLDLRNRGGGAPATAVTDQQQPRKGNNKYKMSGEQTTHTGVPATSGGTNTDGSGLLLASSSQIRPRSNSGESNTEVTMATATAASTESVNVIVVECNSNGGPHPAVY